MKKKWLSILLCIVMITGLFSNSTIAFLTDTDSDANVMTVGNVHIQQIEEQRDAAGNLVEFKQEKPMYPAHYLDQEIPLDSYLNGHENEEAWKIYAANDYVVDKFITVENTGKSDAYVRTILAFERSEHERGREYVHLNYNDIENEVRWEWVAEKLNLGGVMYDVAVATYLKPLSKGEITLPSLKQLYMDKQADNDYYAAFGDRYEIKVLSQTAQAAGFDDADAALNGAFGVLDAANLTELLGGLQYEEQPESEYVVSVANESELAEAIENIANGVYPAGTVVKLSSDIALDKTLEIPASVTAVLDLESYTLTVEPAATGRLFGMRIAYAADWWKDIGNAIRNFGKLTLRGNKTDTPNARGILNKDNGELIIESGYFMQALQNAYAVWNDNGSLTIKDAAIIKHDGEKPETSDEPAPSAVLSTGSDSTVSVTGGEITGQYGALNVQEGKADVTGGKLQVTDETEGVVVNVADTANKVCISGGNLIAGTDENKESGSVTVNGGVAEGKLEVSGGDFSEKSNIKEEHWVEPTATPTVEVTPTPTPTVEVTPTPTPAVTPAPTPFVNKQVETEEDLRELFEIGGSGVLMANLDISETLNVPVDSVVTLDMNDKCISSASGSVDILIYNAGNLTLQNDVVNAYTLCDSGNGNAYLGSLVTNASTGIFTANKLVAVNETGNLIDNQGGQVVINEGLWDIWASRSSTGTVYGFNSNGGSIVINDVETEATRSKGLFYASNNAVITVNGGIFKARKDSNPAYLAVAEDSSSVVLRNNGQYTWEGASFAEVVQGNVINEGCTVTFHTSEPADPLPTLSVTASAVPAAENGMITVTEGENVAISVYPECSDTSVELSYVWKLGDETLSCTSNSYVFAPTLDQNGKTISVTVVTNKEVDVQNATTFVYTLNVKAKPETVTVETDSYMVPFNYTYTQEFIPQDLKDEIQQVFDAQTVTVDELNQKYSCAYEIDENHVNCFTIVNAAPQFEDREGTLVFPAFKFKPDYQNNYYQDAATITTTFTDNANNTVLYTEKNTVRYAKRGNPVVVSGTQNQVNGSELTVEEGAQVTLQSVFTDLDGNKLDMSYEWVIMYGYMGDDGKPAQEVLSSTTSTCTITVKPEYNGKMLTIGAYYKDKWVDNVPLKFIVLEQTPTLSVATNAVPADENGVITVTEGENVAISVNPTCSDSSVELSYVWKLGDETLSCTSDSYLFAPTLDQNGKTISVEVVPSKEVDAQTATTFSYLLSVQAKQNVQQITTYEQLKQLFAEGGTGEITLEPTFSNGVIWLEEPLTVPEGKTVKLQMNGCGIWTKRENETLIYNNGTLILENDTYTIDNLSDYGEALEWLVINNKTGVLEADDICAINEYGGLIQNNGGTVKLTQTNSSCWYTYETPRSGTSNYLFVNTDGGKMDITNTSTDVCIDAGAYYCSGEDSKITVSGGSCFMLGSSTEYMALAENGGTIELRDGVRYKWMDGKVSSGSVSISADCSGTLVPTLSTEEEIRQLFANGGEAVIQSEIQITSPLSVPENVKVQLRATRGSYGLVANAIALTEPLITNNGELELNTLKVFSNSTAGTIVNNGGATLNTDSANIQNMNTGCIINNGGTVKVSYGHVQSSAGAYVFENKGGEATISNATVVYEHDAESPTGGVFYADAGMITVKNIYFLHAPNVNPFTETCYLYDGHLLACTEENGGNISVRSIKNAITYCGTDEFGYYSGYGVTIDPSVNITLQ